MPLLKAAKKISLYRNIMIFLSLVIHTLARWSMAINRFDDCSVSSLINLRMDAATIISQAFEKGTTILRPYNQPWQRCETDKKRHFIIMLVRALLFLYPNWMASKSKQSSHFKYFMFIFCLANILTTCEHTLLRRRGQTRYHWLSSFNTHKDINFIMAIILSLPVFL